MKKYFFIVFIIFIVFAGTKCFNVNAAERKFPYASIIKTCAPWDGAAVAIILNTKNKGAYGSFPYITFSVWKKAEIFTMKKHSRHVEFKFPSNDYNTGSSAYCSKEYDCHIADSSEIVFDEIYSTGHTKGHYIFRLNDKTFSGYFETKSWDEAASARFCG